MKHKIILNRRQFIQSAGIALVGSCFLPRILTASEVACEKSLNLHNIHTGENFNRVFWAEGNFIPDALTDLNKLMRDWRTDEVKEINPELYLLIQNIHEKLGSKKPFDIISGYRCEKTNASLRKKSKGVAQKSRHITGDAIDFSVSDRSLREARKAAVSFKAGGVGYYPAKGFIHVDIREKPILW